MKKWIAMLGMVLAVSGLACAGQLKGMAAWAEEIGPLHLDGLLCTYGLTNAADRVAVTASWDEATLINTCVSRGAYKIIELALRLGPVSTEGMARIKAAVLAQNPPPSCLVDILMAYPVSERGDFVNVFGTAITAQYAATPVYGKLFMKYTVLRGMALSDPDIPDVETVTLLLASEPASLTVVQMLKNSIKNRLLPMARQKLRAEGKSFVVKDGVNPLAVKIQSVVDALNAPECAGLEAALRAIGSDVADQDRAPVRTLVAQWQTKVFAGDMLTVETESVLGKIAVMLGTEAYNRWIDTYNNGTGTL